MKLIFFNFISFQLFYLLDLISILLIYIYFLKIIYEIGFFTISSSFNFFICQIWYTFF
jgi:hypothetical protein